MPQQHISTIGVDHKMKTIQVEIKGVPKRVKLQIWDTAGQERFHSITSGYFRGSHAAILVFALDDDDSLLKLYKWVEELDMNGIKTRILIGNKSDIKQRIVSADRVKASYPTMEYLETSAKSGENVELLFYELAVKLATLKIENVLADAKDTLPTPRRLEYEEPSGNGKCC
jgi:small GTP-binding protein